DRSQEDCGVGGAAKRKSPRYERRAYVFVAVTLAIVDDHVSPISRDHRLMAGRGEVNDGQPAVCQSGAGLWVDPDALVIRAAMPQASVHVADNIAELQSRGLRASHDKAGDATHSFKSKPGSVQMMASGLRKIKQCQPFQAICGTFRWTGPSCPNTDGQPITCRWGFLAI